MVNTRSTRYLEGIQFLTSLLKNVLNVAIPPEVTVREQQQQATNSLFVPHVNRDGNGKSGWRRGHQSRLPLLLQML
mgnify:CR=1 FL=1